MDLPNLDNKVAQPQPIKYSKWLLFVCAIGLSIFSLLVVSLVFFWVNFEDPVMIMSGIRETLIFIILFIAPIPGGLIIPVAFVWFLILIPFYKFGKIKSPRKFIFIITVLCVSTYLFGFIAPARIIEWRGRYEFNKEVEKHSIETPIISTQEFLYTEKTNNELRIMSQRYDGSNKKFTGIIGPLPPVGSDVTVISPKGSYYILYSPGLNPNAPKDRVINVKTGETVLELWNGVGLFSSKGPQWSPDEKYIAFARNSYDINPETKQYASYVTIYDLEERNSTEYKIEYEGSEYEHKSIIAWSPDSKFLYITKDNNSISKLILEKENKKLSFRIEAFSSFSKCYTFLVVGDDLLCIVGSRDIGIIDDASKAYHGSDSIVSVSPSGYKLITSDVPYGISEIHYVDTNYIAASNLTKVYFVDLKSGKIQYMRDVYYPNPDIKDFPEDDNPIIFGADNEEARTPVPYFP